MNDINSQAEYAEIAVANKKPFPSIWAAIGWIALFFALQIIGGIVAVIVRLWDDLLVGNQADILAKATDMNVMALPTIWGLVGSSLITILLLWLYLNRKDRFSLLGLDRWSNLPLVRTLVISVLLIAVGLGFNIVYTEYIVPDIKMQDELHKLFAAIPPTTFNQILLFITVAILAPITEELLFRGLLQKSMSNRMAPALAITIASAIFAAIHLDFYAFPALFVLGAAFGILYHQTGSMRVNILMHIINNGAALLLT